MTKIEWTHRPGTHGESWNPIRARNRESGKIGRHWLEFWRGLERIRCERTPPCGDGPS
jgi:hypothetical protein